MTSNKIRQETAVASGHASGPTSDPPSRNLPVDTLRGVACLLLVTFHVIGYGPTDGIQVSDDSAFRYYTESVDYLRMPLFTLLSGLVYAWRPLTSVGRYPGFMRKKARRLLVPYVTFVPAIGLTQYVLPDAGNSRSLEPVQWLLYSLNPYWFLLTTFWLFAVVALLDSWNLLSSRLSFGVLFLASVGVVLVVHTESFRFLQWGQALSLAPFFLAGVALTRFSLIPRTTRGRLVATVLLVAAVVAVQLALNGVFPGAAAGAGPDGGTDSGYDSRHSVVGISIGILFPMVFLGWSLSSRPLAWIGGYSSGIFLLHSFAVGACHAVTAAVGVTAPPVMFLVSSIGGVALSILGVTVLRRFRVGKIILGENTGRTPR
ncbi:acyltransferase [Corynebacterium sp. USCH3]|uniref:acyltransferase n=1 Tax=Corynebacterium sp. USCH3 TaxID=3024840 RepID=UPI0030A1447A